MRVRTKNVSASLFLNQTFKSAIFVVVMKADKYFAVCYVLLLLDIFSVSQSLE